MTQLTNDNDDRLPPPDAYGQAAFLLTESLLHALLAKGMLTNAEAIEVVEVASDVKADVADAWGDTPQARRKSLELLENVLASLRIDS